MSPPTPDLRLAMLRNGLRSERIKLSAIRSALITLLVPFAAGTGVSAVTCYLASGHHMSFTLAGKATWNPAAFRLDGIQLAGLALVALVALVVISESCWSSPRHVPPSASAKT